MSGFKNFLLRGNLIDLSVAVIVGTSFGAVVTSFTAWITARLPATDGLFADARPGDLGHFLNALISFVVLAAIVYFFVVVPYTTARERYFPGPPPGTPEEIELLREIRNALVGGGATPGDRSGGSSSGDGTAARPD